MKNTINVIKYILERISDRLGDAEEQISNWDDRVMKSTQAEQQMDKRIRRKQNRLRKL